MDNPKSHHLIKRMIAPLGSLTVPLMEAFKLCAQPEAGNNASVRTRSIQGTALAFMCLMKSPL